MLRPLQENKHKHYLLVYGLTFVTYGVHIAGLGPFIPYLSESTGLI